MSHYRPVLTTWLIVFTGYYVNVRVTSLVDYSLIILSDNSASWSSSAKYGTPSPSRSKQSVYSTTIYAERRDVVKD